MQVESQVVVVMLSVLVFALVSQTATRRWLTAPLVFTTTGVVLGPMLGWLTVDPGAEAIALLGEITLVLVLFSDASRIRLRPLRRETSLPLRLLGLGMPLTILAGTLAAMALFDHWTVWEAALLATVLAPTDAAVGQAVVTSAAVPQRIRQTLNVESGLNDGIALPLVLVFLAMSMAEGGSAESWLGFWARQVTLGPLVGLLVGAAGGWALEAAATRGLALPAFQKIGALALAGLCYLLADLAGGNGFMSAFVGGLAFGGVSDRVSGLVHEFLEVEGQLLMLGVFVLLGCSLAGPALAASTAACFLYAALSLTVLRMLPVALALIGSGAAPPTQAFVGWFGPRGLASILFGLLLVEEQGPPHGEEIFTVAVLTVLGSVLLHGLTATSLSEAYGRWVGAEGRMEHTLVDELATR